MLILLLSFKLLNCQAYFIKKSIREGATTTLCRILFALVHLFSMAAGRLQLRAGSLPQISESNVSTSALPDRKTARAKMFEMVRAKEGTHANVDAPVKTDAPAKVDGPAKADTPAKTPVDENGEEQYPLANTWDFWHDRQNRKKSKVQDNAESLSESESYARDIATAPYEDRLKDIHFGIKSVQKFWEVWNAFAVVLRGTTSDRLQLRDTIHLFHHGTKPIWEDPRNVRGGSWTFRVQHEKSFDFWQNLCFLAIGSKLQSAVETKRPCKSRFTKAWNPLTIGRFQ